MQGAAAFLMQSSLLPEQAAQANAGAWKPYMGCCPASCKPCSLMWLRCRSTFLQSCQVHEHSACAMVLGQGLPNKGLWPTRLALCWKLPA